MDNKIKFIDLFAGIGGIRMGFEKNGFECVYSNEIDDHACEMYEANFGVNPKGDITKLNPTSLPDFDLLVGGFPCQSFSICGKQKGFEDARGTLFFDICRILEERKPKAFMLENVFESIEIKLDKKITAQIIRVVESKVYKWNPQRYYVLSVDGIETSEKDEINEIVLNVLNNHGCQIIINGLIPTIKYYLRLINNLDDFVRNYSKAVQDDNELQKVHKEKWGELLVKYCL